MKERTLIGGMVTAITLLGVIAVTRSTDVIFVAASIAFFALCIAYAKGCERL